MQRFVVPLFPLVLLFSTITIWTGNGKAKSQVSRVSFERDVAATASQFNIADSSTTTSQLRILSWNIQFGEGTDAIRDFDRTATSISNINPDVVALCEIPPTDVPQLVSLLAQKSGIPWNSQFVPKYPGCPEGNLILSKYPLLSVGSFYLSYNRSVAQATISVGGKTINFFATHLDDASSANRYTEVGELTNWAANFAEPRIFAGDFNGGPDTSEVIRMTNSYYDSWAQALNMGTAAAYPDNPVGVQTRTRRGRIDYVFYSAGLTDLQLRRARIPDSRDLSNTNVVTKLGTLDDLGVRPSDHNQMIAEFDLGGSSATPTPTPTPTPPTPTPTPTPGAIPQSTFQFTVSGYSGREGGSAEISVTRTGDLSTSNSVSYSSADLTAQQRSDYIIAAGSLAFAAGETTKTFPVFMVDDGYIDPFETFSVTLTDPTNGAVVGSQATAIISISDNDTSQATASPLNNASFFVQQHYLDFLNRAADVDGLNFWTNEILVCGGSPQCVALKRINVSAAFFLSIEFQETGFIACLANQAAFGNAPPYILFVRDSQTLRKNYIFGQPGASVQLESNKQLYFNELVGRAAFRARYDPMNNSQFVDTLIGNTAQTLLADRQILINALNNGTETRATVLRKFAENPYFKGRQFNSVFVLMEYFGYLRRDPDPAGFDFWLRKLNSFNGNFVEAEMVKAFIGSSEYSGRFSDVPMQ